MHQIGFAEIGSHLCQYFPVGNPYVYRKSQLVPDAVLDDASGVFRGRIVISYRGIIHITFVHADLFDVGRKI